MYVISHKKLINLNLATFEKSSSSNQHILPQYLLRVLRAVLDDVAQHDGDPSHVAGGCVHRPACPVRLQCVG